MEVVVTDDFLPSAGRMQVLQESFLANLALRFKEDVAFSMNNYDICCLATKTGRRISFSSHSSLAGTHHGTSFNKDLHLLRYLYIYISHDDVT